MKKTFKKDLKADSDVCIDTCVEVTKLHLEQDNLNDERPACTAILTNLESIKYSKHCSTEAMMRFEKRRQRDDEEMDRFLDDMESFRRRSDPEESTNGGTSALLQNSSN